MHKVFITYHHDNDQHYKDRLLELNQLHPTFVDRSVNTGDIPDSLTDQAIRQKIRDEYLRDSTVTIVLVGTETKNRKHVDWEIYSSMYDGAVNKKSGIIVVNLPPTNCSNFHISHDGEQEALYPLHTVWDSVVTEMDYRRRYPYLSERLIDNLMEAKALVSVVNWSLIENNFSKFGWLIEATFNDRGECEYDLSRNMQRDT